MEIKQEYMVVPELDIVSKILETDLEDNIVLVYRREILKKQTQAQLMGKEIKRLEEIKNNQNAELINSQQIFLTGKQLEYDYLRIAAGIKIAYLNQQMSRKEYSNLRDNILTSIILERAKVKRYLTYIRLYAKRTGMILNKEWFDKFDTILDDSNKSISDLERANEIAKDLLEYLTSSIKNGVSVLPEEDEVKDAMLVMDVIPSYINSKELKSFKK